MIVFKLYFKILFKNIVVIIINVAIFLAITFMVMQSYGTTSQNFEVIKTSVTFFDEDKTTLTNGLKDYLSDYAEFIDVDEEGVDDAFFYREVMYIVRIPKGFTTSFTNDNPLQIEKRTVPDAASGYFFEAQMNKYLSLAYTYVKNDLAKEDELVEKLKTDLGKAAEYEFPDVEKSDYGFTGFYYNYLAYILIALIVSVTGAILLTFSSIELKRRNSIASISDKKMNLVLILSSVITGVLFLGIFVVISFVMFPGLMFKGPGPYLILNSLVYSLVIIALAYLLTVLFKSKQVISGMGTVFSLGLAFITGVFIPQSVMKKEVLMLGRVFPSFYYVESNDKLVRLANFSFENMKSIYINMLIMLAFGLIFVVLSIIISNKKRQAEN